jgi:RND superfamily putative drug exporter
MLLKGSPAVRRRARLVLGLTAVLLAVAAVFGSGVFDSLKSGGFDDPASESTRARHLIETRFGGQTNLVLLVHAKSGSVDSRTVRAAGAELTAALDRMPGVANVASYWSTRLPSLKSADGTYAVVVGHVAGDDQQVADRTAAIVGRYSGDRGAITVLAGGEAAANRDVRAEVNRSLAVAEAIAVPLILVLLVIAFGSFAAALLPLLIGAIAIVGTFAELRLLGSVTDVSVFAVNLTTALGLGLSVDYALLMVSRFRECLAAGARVDDAVAQTMRTAGRTIVFSAVTVAAALATLLVFPQFFLRSFAYAGVGVVLIAAVAALVVVPAMLASLGHRVNAGRLPWVQAVRAGESRKWGWLAATVMRRPLLTATPVVALLLLAASPLLGVSFGSPDQGTLPHRTASRQVADLIEARFAGNQAAATDVVVVGAIAPEQLRAYARELSYLDGVGLVRSSVGAFALLSQVGDPAADLGRPDVQRLSVVITLPPKSAEAQRLIREIRMLPGPSGGRVLVSSADARLADTKHAIGVRLPLAGGLVGLTTFVVLLLFTGSVVQAVRALLLNTLSLAATLGVMTWIFQDGHLAGLLGFTPRALDTSMTVLLLCIGFGLSMDYEVFLISRIKELHDGEADTVTAVTQGLARTGRIVSTAAGLLAVSFFVFGTSTVNFLQMFGLGAGLAVLIDATLVRGVLVPATMRLLGPAAWYSPAVLGRLHGRVSRAAR